MKLALTLYALVALFAGAPQTAPPAPRPDESFDVKHYDVSLRLDFKERAVAGEAEIELVSRLGGLGELVFDAGELEFESVREGATNLEFKPGGGKLSVRLARPAARGETRRIKILYRGRNLRGLRIFADHAYTLYNTRGWLPCRFHPSDKASVTLRLTVPDGMKTVANGKLVEQRGAGEGTTEHVWRHETPIPAYIFGFAAGRFREVADARRSDIRTLFRAPLTDEEARRVFADTPDAAAFFEQAAGFALPGGGYTHVLAEGRVEQEMSNFTVIRETYARQVLKEPRDSWLGVHELSHEWWGNSLTCADWSHFWLNESIASFMADAYLGRRFGREEYDAQMELSREVYARLRAAGRDRPLAYRYPIEERNAGGLIVYDKGALVLHLLRFELGERAFWQGLRDYTRAHEGGSVTTDDLQRAMERASGRDLAAFFDHWVYSAEPPALSARHRVEGKELVVTIEQRQQKLRPVTLRVAVETSRGRAARTFVLKERRQEFRLPATAAPLSVRLDDGGHLPVRVSHERPAAMLLRQLAREPDLAGRLDALDELQKLCGGGNQTRDQACGSLPTALAERAAKDSSRLVRERARKALSPARP